MAAFSRLRRWLRQHFGLNGLERPVCRLRAEELEPRVLLASDSYLLPGDARRLFEVEGQIQHRQADFRNEVGIYQVDDAEGRVDGLAPSDPGYSAAALRRAQTLFNRHSRAGTRRTFTFRGGTRLGLYLVQNRTIQAWRRAVDRGAKAPVFFSFDLANADRFDHLRCRSWNGPTTQSQRYTWEDETRGGDRDFNDAVFTFGIARELPPLAPLAAVQQSSGTGSSVFVGGLRDWTAAQRDGSPVARGRASVGNGSATLREGDSFNATLSHAFTVPAASGPLSFSYTGLNFDTADPSFVNDAFEVALLDAAGNSLVPAFAPGRDSFFNVTEGLVPALGSGTTRDGQTVRVSLAGVPAGTVATLVFRLVNNDSDIGTTVTIANVAFPGPGAESNPPKFFVADAAGTFRYHADGLADGHFATNAAQPRGIATNAAGDRVWVLDRATRRIDVHRPDGTLLGAWTATDLDDPQGLAHEAANLWAVDRGTRRVQRYAAAQDRTSGSTAATDGFALDAENTSPSDLATDGSTVWVTDDVRDEVFVYAVGGVLLGRWQLDAANTEPSGITRDPLGGADLWVVDRQDREVYHYANGVTLRSGAAIADGTFTLALDNSSPEAIADPPPQTSEGHSLLDPSGRAVFDTAEDFRVGTLFNVTAVDATGEIRLNAVANTEIAPFIWVANAGDGTISRFDARTGREIGRYRTGPDGGVHSPSRTGVAADGSVWVANRAFNVQASMIHVLLNDAVDRNGNGVIDTSTDLNGNGTIEPVEMFPWDGNGDGTPDDERIALSIDIGRDRTDPSLLVSNGVGRSVAFDADGNVWVGLYNLGQYEVYDPRTGNLLAIVAVPGGSPYGARVDANGTLWGANDTEILTQIDMTTRTFVRNIPTPGATDCVTVDPDGIVWVTLVFSAAILRYDPTTGEMTTYATPNGENTLRGIGVDNARNIWVASSAPNRLVKFEFAADHKTLTGTKVVNVGIEPTAVILDTDGFVWTTTRFDNRAWKIDPVANVVVPGWPVATGRDPYNSSSVTSRVWQGNAERMGTWTETIDAERAGAAWSSVGLESVTPGDTSVTVRVRTADVASELPSRVWRTILPDTVYPDLLGRYLQVEVSLRSRDPVLSPSVRSITVTGQPGGSGGIDFSKLTDLTASFQAEYARTSFRQAGRTLFADVSLRNTGLDPVGVPLVVGVKNISDPTVRPLGTNGVMPDGTPYYNFTGLVGGAALPPGAATGTLSLAFADPGRKQFSYDLVVYGMLNRP